MDKYTIYEIDKISKLISYDRSKTLFEQESIFTQQMFNPNYGVFSNPDTAKDWTENISSDFDSFSSFLCGDNSPFKDWFTIPWLEYPSEELFCDIVSGILIGFGPIGATAAIGIEIAHARDLYNKGDKLGAAISLTLGMIPLFGDAAAIGLRSLLRKVGKNGFTKVLGVFTIGLKVISGEVGATTLRKSIIRLSKSEREILYRLWATSTSVVGSIGTTKETVEYLLKSIDPLPGLKIWKTSLNKILDLINDAGITSKMIDFLAQQLSIFTLILAPRVFVELGIAEDDLSFESQEELFQYMVNHPEEFTN